MVDQIMQCPLSRRLFLSSIGVALAIPRLSFGANNGLTKVWVQVTTGGKSYRPSFHEIFADPMFGEMEIWPLDHPNNFSRLFPSGNQGKGPGVVPGFGRGVVNGKGLPAGPPIAKDEPFDYPWDPSGGRGDPGFDVLVLNDQLEWTDSARANIQKGVEQGKGFVVIHHALGDNNTWPWWYQEVTGGLLVLSDHDGMKKSTITPSALLDARPVGKHPVLEGVEPFRVAKEETFKGMWQSSKITPLLQTTSPGSDKTIAWIGVNSKAKVVCIQPGSSTETDRNPNYRRLVRNSILWVSGRLS